MHSSGMRTVRNSSHLLPGGVPAPGGLVPGGCLLRGCLLGGVPAPGDCLLGGGGACLGGMVSQIALRQTSPCEQND